MGGGPAGSCWVWGTAAPGFVGELDPAGGGQVMGGSWVSHRPLGALRGWRLYHLFEASRRCQEMGSEAALVPAVLQLRQVVPTARGWA